MHVDYSVSGQACKAGPGVKLHCLLMEIADLCALVLSSEVPL